MVLISKCSPGLIQHTPIGSSALSGSSSTGDGGRGGTAGATVGRVSEWKGVLKTTRQLKEVKLLGPHTKI